MCRHIEARRKRLNNSFIVGSQRSDFFGEDCRSDLFGSGMVS
jgi:hypothetical protein